MSETTMVTGIAVPGSEEVLTPAAKAFVAELEKRFGSRRRELLAARVDRQARIRNGERPAFLESTRSVREDANWRVTTVPADLQDRRVEITGPAEPKMMINALNSSAQVFMADLEDSLSPTWENIVGGQLALKQAVRRSLAFSSPEGKSYALKPQIATLVVRPRGWHLEEKNFQVDGRPISGSLFDFGLYFFHNAKEALARGTGPYFYLPKMESHLEARLWADVIRFSEEKLGVPAKSTKATVLIETILAAFEMEEILYELRDFIVALNAGRWDYIFSIIKKFSHDPAMILPDRAQVTMTVPFMRAYTELLVRSCHKRGAHAMGGMAAFIPSRKDPEVNARAIAKVREDKEREARDGFDGTWVAHPDLVPVAGEVFTRVLEGRPNQKDRLREDVKVQSAALIDLSVPGGKVTEEGVRLNVNVALQYVERWLSGVGAAAIHHLMEDAATAEISRAQLWQWIRHGKKLDDGRAMTTEIYRTIRKEEFDRLGGARNGRLAEAAELLDALVLETEFKEFLTLPAYQRI